MYKGACVHSCFLIAVLIVSTAEQSPSSEDSSGGNFGPDAAATTAATNRIHLSPGPHFSTLKLSSSSPSTPHTASTTTGKLFATCLVCGKQLSNQYNLRVHMETHQNVNYACGVCSHISRSRDALRKHVSYRHPGEGRDKATLTGPRERRCGLEGRNRSLLGSGTNGVDVKTRVALGTGSNGVGTQGLEGMDRTGSNAVGKGMDRVGEEIASRKIKVITDEDNKHP